MSQLLASVNSLDEALLVLAAGVDIIDLKQPAAGALGALACETVTTIVKTITQRRPVSATVGDLPMQPAIVSAAVSAMAATGVDYIKIGFFPDGDTLATLQALQILAQQHALIAVLFADIAPDFSLLPAIKAAGFRGVMLDTMNKQNGALTQFMSTAQLAEFVVLAKQQQLLCGLAGSLRLTDIAVLLPLQANYLGFRGALCEQHNRVGQLNETAIQNIKQAMTHD